MAHTGNFARALMMNLAGGDAATVAAVVEAGAVPPLVALLQCGCDHSGLKWCPSRFWLPWISTFSNFNFQS